MAAPLTPISPLPFLGFSVSLPDAVTVVELDPQPYSNTGEIILLNLSTTDEVYVQIADLSVIPASADLGISSADPPLAGDVITIDGVPLTGVAGAQATGTDTFSATVAPTATVTVNSSPLADGDTLSFGVFSLPTLTGAAGGGGAGTNTFDATAGSQALIAASIAAALVDPANTISGFVTSAVPAGATVTITWRSGGASTNGTSVDVVTTPAGGMTGSAFAGGLDAVPAPSATGINTTNNTTIQENIVAAINDPTNSFSGICTAYVPSPGVAPSAVLRMVSVLSGSAGNGVPYVGIAGRTIPGGADVFSGGEDALPAAAAVTAANSTRIPAGGAVALAFGPEGARQPLATSAFWAINPGSRLGIVAKLAGGAAADLNVTYLQGRGYVSGP